MDAFHVRSTGGWAQYLVFNVIDDFNCDALTLPVKRIIRALNQVLEWRGLPQAIYCDNGPECISQKVKDWAKKLNIRFEYILADKPQQNTYAERYNWTMRYDWLNYVQFESVAEIPELATD
ncbi:DDE-type integrase/transposase/recombinase [Deefgea rivuli]|uniref:DDE-type integrase/transposase/recombinase n=1 Tax=Deefgea rivuli TaxID=400948 RepID=UPI00146FA946|nr:DDE-type integrase/transposase/recombinase [Deefgea rivuli]